MMLQMKREENREMLIIFPFLLIRLHKQAGVLLLGTAGMIPPLALEHMETTCPISENKVIHPFAFRVHTHSLGKVVSGWRIRNGIWTLLGKRDPMKPQMFYPLNNTEPIVVGDTLAARCTMLSNRKRVTFIGYVSFYFKLLFCLISF